MWIGLTHKLPILSVKISKTYEFRFQQSVPWQLWREAQWRRCPFYSTSYTAGFRARVPIRYSGTILLMTFGLQAVANEDRAVGGTTHLLDDGKESPSSIETVVEIVL